MRFYEQTFFWISYIKWYKFYDNDLSVVLGSKQGWRWIELSVNSIADSLGLNFLVYFVEMQVIFQWKQTKDKLGNGSSARKDFCLDLTCRIGNICQPS